MVVADRVVVELEARTGAYTRNLRAAETVATRSARGITSAFRTVGAVLAGLGVGVGVKGIVDLTSAWTDLNSRVVLAAGSMERGGAVMDRLQAIARRTYSSLTQTAESYLQNSTSLRELGYSTQDQLDLTESLNNALVISAARGDQARSVMDAWSKAMAFGELRGENLNTVIQSGGRLAEALAQSMGVSTNELRRLGAEGKITTREMFGVTSQLEQLRTEADNMPATVADGFQLLSDAIFVFIGNANEASGVSEVLAGYLIDLADAINSIPEGWYQRVFGGIGDEIARQVELAQSDLQQILDLVGRIGDAFNYLNETSLTDAVGDAFNEISGENARRAQQTIFDVQAAFSALITQLEVEARGAGSPLADELAQIWEQVIINLESAEDAQLAIARLIAQYPDAAPLLGDLMTIAGQLGVVRGEADAAAASMLELARVEQAYLRTRDTGGGVDLSDDGAPGGPIAPPRATSRGGSRGPSPEQRFQEALEAQRRQTEMLREETAVRAGLNPLVDDYGYALERLRIQQELENEATRAGLALTPERVAAISMLADEYARATVEAARLSEQQEGLKRTVEEWAGIMQQATRGFIDDLLEGKDAAEAFGNVLRNIGNQLINLGLSGIFGGGGPFQSLLGGVFGGFRANGGPVSSGRSYIVGERGPELFTPSSGGRIIPNHDLGGGGDTRIVLEVQEGAAFTTRVLQVSGPQSVRVSSGVTQRYDQNLQNRTAEKSARYN